MYFLNLRVEGLCCSYIMSGVSAGVNIIHLMHLLPLQKETKRPAVGKACPLDA